MKNRRLAALPLPLALVLCIWAASLEAQGPPAAAHSPASLSAAAPVSAPPKAATRPVSDTYFGRTIADPYRWMEEEDNPELEKWLRAQNEHSRRLLDALPARTALRQRVLELDKSVARVNGVQSVARRLFYLKTEPGGEIPRLYVRPADGGGERLLVDPTSRGEGGRHAAIDFVQPSWDGRLVAYGLSKGGSEESVIHVLDVETGKDLDDRIDRCQYGYVSWLPDNRSFFYFRLNQLAPGAHPSERLRRLRAYVHRVGTQDADRDEPVLGYGVSKDVAFGEDDFPIVLYSPTSSWLLGLVGHGVRNELTLYVAPLSRLSGSRTPWRKAVGVEDEVTFFDVMGDDLYLMTHKGAPRFKITRTSLSKPQPALASVVVPEGPAVISWLGMAKDGLYYRSRDGSANSLMRIPIRGGKTADPVAVPLPSESGRVNTPFVNPAEPGLYFNFITWTTSSAWLRFDTTTGRTVDTNLAPPSSVSFDNVEVRRLIVPSHDGVKVPLTVLLRKGQALDGRRPTLVSAYGAYGNPLMPSFAPSRLAWLERGGVLAFAHVRGGGEFGDDWHKAGQKKTKRNSILDFIACAEHLVAAKYTAPAYLAGTGGSAGGIVIGGALVRRPDLFAAALPDVPLLNTLRGETDSTGPANIPEFGTVKVKEEFEALLEMDAYHAIKEDGAYPAVMLTTGRNDPRVPVWQPAKFAARLQALPNQAKPVLLRVDFDAGHGMGSTRSQFMEELADQWSFLLWQFSDAAFQPAANGNGGAINDVRATTGDPSAAPFAAEALLGTWTFNAQKSDFSAVTLKFTETPGGGMEMWSNGESHEFIADGKDRKALYGYTEAWTRLGPSTWEVATKLEGRLLGTEVMTVSPDGGTLTRTLHATTGTTVKEKTTYRRLGRGAGLAGTWQTQTVEGPQDIRFERDGDMLRYVVPRWETVGTARLDGRDYPLTSPGLATGTTWSIKQTGKNTFEWTFKHPGDVDWVGTITISDDGRVLTDHDGPKGGQRMMFVYEKQ